MIAPSVFGEAAAIADRVASVAVQMRSSSVMPGFDDVRVPGDGRAARMDERAANGVPITNSLCGVLDRLAEDLGITPLGARNK